MMRAAEENEAFPSLLLNQRITQLSSTLDSLGCGVISVSNQGILSYNQKFIEMWQIPESLIDIDAEEYQKFFIDSLVKVDKDKRYFWQRSSEPTDDKLVILELKDGRVFAQSAKPQRIGKDIVGTVWSLWDNTEFKKSIEPVEVTRHIEKDDLLLEDGKAIGELKTRFLSGMCHQFRSFLNIISFSNSLLKISAGTEAEKSKLNYLNNIQSAVDQISTLLDRLLFLGQSEIGRLNLEAKPTDISTFCRDLTAQVEPISSTKGQTLKFSCQDNLKIAWIDTDIVEQIAINLLCNALKYTPEGGTISFRVLGTPEKLIIQVEDSGIGIPAIDRQRIFEPFYRGGNVKDAPGTGLGLSIVKNLIKLHSGSINLESQEGIGTTFTVVLPVKTAIA